MNLRKKMVYSTHKIKKYDNKHFVNQIILFNQIQRKYDAESENRRMCEENLDKIQRLLETEKQAKNEIGATNREWIEKITNLERQVKKQNKFLLLISLSSFIS